MSPRLKSVLLQGGGLVLGLGLLALALRAVPFSEVWADMRRAHPGYLALFLGVAMAAHAIRSWRWQILLGALHREGGGTVEVRFWPAFSSVMIGYMVNYAAPRLGEVVRTANLSARERLPFSGVLGTVVIERVLDILVLGLCVLVSLGLGARGLLQVGPLLAPARSAAADLPVATVALAAIAVLIVLGLGGLILWRMRRSAPSGSRSRLLAALAAFREGLSSVWRSPRRVTVLASTFAIWGCYLLLAYLPLPMLGIEGLGLAEAWALLVVGSIGVAIPTPGGVGSYHYLTIQALTRMFGVGAGLATAYAVLSHALQLVLYCSVGFACLIAQGGGLRLRPAPARAPSPPPQAHPQAQEPPA